MTLTPDWIPSCTRRRLWSRQRVLLAFTAHCGLNLAVSLACGVAPAAAQGRLQAQYEATLVGVSVGKGTLNIDIQDDRYSVTVGGGTVGLVKYFKSGSFAWLAQGRVVNGALVPTNYKAATTAAEKTEEISIMLANGNVTDFSIVPEPPVDPARFPVTDTYHRGVLDPLTSLSVQVPGTGDLVTPEACQSGVAVFDGRFRYDRNRVFMRMDAVETKKGYRGPVVVCAGRIVPVAGFTPEETKEIGARRNNEIAFAPIAGTRILVPFWIKETTPLGSLKIEATSFITEPQTSRNSRTQ